MALACASCFSQSYFIDGCRQWVFLSRYGLVGGYVQQVSLQSVALQQPKEAIQVNGDRAENESEEYDSDDDSEDEEETTEKEMAETSQEDCRLASIPQVWTWFFLTSLQKCRIQSNIQYVRGKIWLLVKARRHLRT